MSVSHVASSSRALYFVAATVQKSHSKFVWTASMRVLALHNMRVCDVRLCYDT